jgi:hypothetical protein
MKRDGRAGRLLVLGLVTPSDDLWISGSQGLQRPPLGPGDFPVSDRIGKSMHEVDAAVRVLGARAGEARTPDERMRAYGTIVAGCASCHTRHRTLWEAPR